MGRFIRRGILVLFLLTVVGAIGFALVPRPIEVEKAVVETGPMRETVDEEGKTRIRERYVVSSPLAGRVRRIALDPGDRVREGETILAVIEPTDPALLDARALAEAQARVRAAEAAVRQAGAHRERLRAEYDYAEDELARIGQAHDDGAASPRELERGRNEQRRTAEALRAAEFAQEIARFELEQAESALAFTEPGSDAEVTASFPIRSPISGDVLRVVQKSVAVVGPGTPLLELGDRADLEIVIDVLSTDAVRVTPGAPVVIEHWGGEAPLEARVRIVEPSAFTKISALGIEEQRVNVIADFVSPPADRATLGDGYRVDARIVIWEADDVVRIPSSAAFRDGDGWAVYAIEDGVARQRAITPGRSNRRSVQILAGLEPGDTIIAHPTDRVSDGVRVE